MNPIARLMPVHQWWRHQTVEIASLAIRSERFTVRWRRNLAAWSGLPWDGISTLPTGDDVVTGEDVQKLLAQLKLATERLALPRVTAPTPADVRVTSAGLAERETLTVDFDLIDFILPIAVETSAIAGGPAAFASAVEGVIKQLEAAVRSRKAIARREVALRRAVEQTSARIGNGCTPLWLRMDPVPGAEQPSRLLSRHYKVVTTLLDDSLSTSQSPAEPVWTVADVRDHARLHRQTQRQRAAALLAHLSAGSIGDFTEVSLALIRAAELEPFATLQAAHAARVDDQCGDLRFRMWGCLNILSWIDGVLRTSIEFEHGRYDDGQLILTGDYPASLALASKGRPLAAILDHPAFRTIAVTVASVEYFDDALGLYHENRVIQMEQRHLVETALARVQAKD